MAFGHFANDPFDTVATVFPVGKIGHALDKCGGVSVVQQPVGMLTQGFFKLLEVPHTFLFQKVGLRRDWHRLAIDDEALVQVRHFIPRHTHHPLDVVQARLWWVAKHQHIPARRLVAFDDFGVDDGEAHTIGELVHQDQVTDTQRRDHRARRNLEGFKEE